MVVFKEGEALSRQNVLEFNEEIFSFKEDDYLFRIHFNEDRRRVYELLSKKLDEGRSKSLITGTHGVGKCNFYKKYTFHILLFFICFFIAGKSHSRIILFGSICSEKTRRVNGFFPEKT